MPLTLWEKYYVAAVVLYFVALFLTKATVVVLCRKLFSFNMKRSRLMCDVVIGICGLWCLGAILGLTIGCDSLDQIGYETTFCHDLVKFFCLNVCLDHHHH